MPEDNMNQLMNELQTPIMEGTSVTIVDLMIVLNVTTLEEVSEMLSSMGEEELQQIIAEVEAAKQQDPEGFEQASTQLIEQLVNQVAQAGSTPEQDSINMAKDDRAMQEEQMMQQQQEEQMMQQQGGMPPQGM